MLQLLGESLHCVGMLQLCCSPRLRPASDCPRLFSLSRDLARQALLFLGRLVLSFFVSPILTVFYLIDLCDKEQKKERLRRRLWFLCMVSVHLLLGIEGGYKKIN